MPEMHQRHRNQFGFKRFLSCSHALFAAKETIVKYAEHGSPCHVVSLDAENAFEKVWRVGLFSKLKGKVNSNVLQILKKYYNTSEAMTKLGDSYSSRFVIRCGVKQGGIH